MKNNKPPIEQRRNYNYRYNKKQPIWKTINLFFKIALHKPKEIINLNDEPIEDKALILAPHHGKWGPIYLNMYYPHKTTIMGHYAMLGNYKSRYNYLSKVLYLQKTHRSKFRAYVPTIIEAIFSINSYRAMRIIPTYPDSRFTNSIRQGCKLIDDGFQLVIFPEDSDQGYQKEFDHFHPGFYFIPTYYNKTHEQELPIYPVYYLAKKRKIVIGKKVYLSELKGKSHIEVADYFRIIMNNLYNQYFKD